MASEALRRASEQPKFGNAGDVENLLAHGRLRQERSTSTTKHTLSFSSLRILTQTTTEHPMLTRIEMTWFPDLSGPKRSLSSSARQYHLMADGMRQHQIDHRYYIPWTLIFKDPPGTDKTRVAMCSLIFSTQ